MNYFVFQTISLILGLFYLIKNKSFFVKFLFFFLLITATVELIGYFSLKFWNKPSFVYHHVYMFFQFLLINLMYNLIVNDKKGLLLSKMLSGVFFVFWVLIFFDSNYFPYAQIMGSINVGLLVFLYFKELLLSNEITDYKKLLPFWVSIGFAVFYLGSIPFFALWNYFKTDGRGLFYILHILIVLMNVFVSIGLIIKLVEVNKNTKKGIEKINR